MSELMNASQVVANIAIGGTVSTVGAPSALTTLVSTRGSGSATLVAAPGAGSIVAVSDMLLQFTAGTVATTLTVKAGTVNHLQVYFATVGDGFVFAPDSGKEMRLAENQPLVFDNTAGTVAYTVRYAIEAA